MKRSEFESYLINNGWQDIKYVPPKYTVLHAEYKESGGSGIYEKDVPIALKRLKLLKTSVRLEIRMTTGWRKVALIYYKDLKLDINNRLCIYSSEKTEHQTFI